MGAFASPLLTNFSQCSKIMVCVCVCVLQLQGLRWCPLG